MALIGPFSASQGLNTRASNFTIPKDQATVLAEMFPVYGNLVNRTNIYKVNSVATGNHSIYGMTFWVDSAQRLSASHFPTLVVVATNVSTTKIYSGVVTGSPNTVTFSDVTGALTPTAGGDENVQFASLNGILIGTTGSRAGDKPFKITTYNGNAAALGGSPPSANACIVANNFLFLSRNLSSTATLSRIYWSAASDPETWPAASNLDFRLNDGDEIIALANFNEDVIIFKRRSMGRLSTTSQTVSGTVTLGPLTTISTTVGCSGVDLIDKLPDGRIIFMDSTNHVRIFDGSSNILDLSDQLMPGPSIQPSLNGIGAPQLDGIPQGSLRVFRSRNQAWIATFSGGNPGPMFIYNYLENTWSSSPVGSASNTLTYGYAVASDFYADYLYMSDQSGFVWAMEQGNAGPSDTTGANTQATATFSISLPPDFVPRTLLIPATLGSGGSLTVTLGFNGTMNGSSSTAITRTNNKLWNLVDIRQNTLSPGRPLTMQIQIQPTAGKTFTLYPLWVSDEVLSNFS